MSDLAKLKWRCRRGMKELDVLLTRYLEQYYEPACLTEQRAFQALLELSDAKLYNYLIKNEKPVETSLLLLVEKIK
jgi:antitoxin CptB